MSGTLGNASGGGNAGGTMNHNHSWTSSVGGAAAAMNASAMSHGHAAASNVNNLLLHEDTLGGELKTGVAQIIACVLSKDPVNNCKQFVPWLFSPPSTTQQGFVCLIVKSFANSDCALLTAFYRPKEFIECVGYVRMLSWLLLGSLTSFQLNSSTLPVYWENVRPAGQSHNTEKGGTAATVLKSLPPVECNNHIAEYILVLLTGFMEHNVSTKSSILTMSALFHAFICCQVSHSFKLALL